MKPRIFNMEFNKEQLQKLDDLKKKHFLRITINKNVISTVHNNIRYSLVLNNFQLDKFYQDFKENNLTFDFTFWLRALFLLGFSYKQENDFPE